MNNNIKKTKLEDLSYDKFFESGHDEMGLEDFFVARVIAEYKGAYRVKKEDGEYLAKITGKQMLNAKSRKDYPAVGDWVIITKPNEEQTVIHKILPRKTILSKKYSNKQENQIIATNIDKALVVEAVNRDYNLNRFERYFVLASDGGIKPVVLLNKIDLISDAELKLKVDQIKKRFNNVDIFLTSTITNKGIDELIKYIKKGKTYCFLGSSGVGKSSLINKLIGEKQIKTGEISGSTGRGKHVTTRREMYFLENGGILIDNPGTREVGVTDSGAGIDKVFAEIKDLSKKCKYNNCTHMHENGCAVLEAIENNSLDKDVYHNYTKIKKETDYYEMSESKKREKNRKFGKFVKKSLKQLKNYK